MNCFFRFIAAILLTGPAAMSGQAAFTSLYVFGDGVSTTSNDNSGAPSSYYGGRRCNGRVWVEVLAERQGLTFDPAKNNSYYGHYSYYLHGDITALNAPDASNAIFVVWVCDADFVWNMSQIYPWGNPSEWTSTINQYLTNHFAAITNLYSKGARTIIMPNAVDIAKVPAYQNMDPPYPAMVRQWVIDFNTGLTSVISQAKASLPGLKIYVPDFFANLDSVLAHPSSYGLVNPGIDALSNLGTPTWDGPGAYYVFWDDEDPTAKVQEIMADIAQQLVSPVRISKVTPLAGTNKLDIVNVPIGLNGFVDSSTNFLNWTAGPAITSTNASQSVLVPTAGLRQFYRLRFPYAWSWP